MEKLSENLKKKFSADIEILSEAPVFTVLKLNNKKLIKKTVWELRPYFDILYSLAVVDYSPIFELNYVFSNYSNAEVLVMKVNIDEKDYNIDSISGIFDSANWEEREAYDCILAAYFLSTHPMKTGIKAVTITARMAIITKLIT